MTGGSGALPRWAWSPGALFGIAGTFAASDSLRGLAWASDGTALIVAAALLTMRHARLGNDLAAAGFLVFTAGETLIVCVSAATLEAATPTFAAGSVLWAASLAMVSASRIVPPLVQGLEYAAALLFTRVAVQIFTGAAVTPLSRPLPFFALPLFAGTLFGWARVDYREAAPG